MIATSDSGAHSLLAAPKLEVGTSNNDNSAGKFDKASNTLLDARKFNKNLSWRKKMKKYAILGICVIAAALMAGCTQSTQSG
ncbi:MAG: hypothetical protein ACXV2B_09020, partial [Halobacteriota archaeon]